MIGSWLHAQRDGVKDAKDVHITDTHDLSSLPGLYLIFQPFNHSGSPVTVYIH